MGLTAELTMADSQAGEVRLETLPSGNKYTRLRVHGLWASGSGTYAYSRPKANVGRFVGQDSVSGSITIDFNFSKMTSGSVTVTTSKGTYTGTFTLTGTNFASVTGGVLTINGTDDSDAISASLSGNQYVLTRNNITQNVATTAINEIDFLAGTGNDVIDASTLSHAIYVNAGAGNDQVNGGLGKDTITGGAGKNTLNGNGGDDRINGGSAADSISGGAAADRIYGNVGNDTLDGGTGVDRLFGGDGNDLLLGGSSNDKLYGEAGADTLKGQSQSDFFDGGPGTDTAYTDDLDQSPVNVETTL